MENAAQQALYDGFIATGISGLIAFGVAAVIYPEANATKTPSNFGKKLQLG